MKNKYNIYFIFLLVSLLNCINVISQEDTVEIKQAIKTIGRAYPEKIIIRWAPTTPYTWQQANKYGYIIERVTMTRKNKLLKERPLKLLTTSPIKPYSEDEWEKVVRDEKGNIDQYAAIAVQGLYGESFALSESYSNNIVKVIEKAQENEKRFTFALFAADQSLKVARAMGLLYIDNDVNEDEKYLYLIRTNIPAEIMEVDTGYIFIGPADYTDLPRPMDLHADFSENDVTLTWNRELFERTYSNYIVERSENSKDFYALDDLPFVNTSPNERINPRLMYRVDSLPENKTYYYRVRGRTPFDEFGPWSDTVAGQPVKVLEYKPAIQKSEVIDNKLIKLNWEFPVEYEANIEYFSVYRSNKANGLYNVIVENLNPNLRTYTDQNPMPTNYYIIKAFDSNKKSGSSFPALVQLVDSFPPSKPGIPKASIDTLGNVTLSWQKGLEEDILGYRVFRSNFKNEEFGQITNSTLEDTIFTEQISLGNLSRKIYYRIAAIDYNFNQSELSDPVLLIKPDILPPSPPLFKKAHSKTGGAELEWINSSSKDVSKYILYRRQAGNDAWTTIAVFPAKDSINFYKDSLIQAKLLFEYTMIAVDSANNESTPCKSVFVRKIDNGIRPRIENIKINVDLNEKRIEVSWVYPYLDVKNYLIYRSANNTSISYYKTIKGTETLFVDKNVEINTDYNYGIKAVFEDGSESMISSSKNIKF